MRDTLWKEAMHYICRKFPESWLRSASGDIAGTDGSNLDVGWCSQKLGLLSLSTAHHIFPEREMA
jgi:hypothetical protein